MFFLSFFLFFSFFLCRIRQLLDLNTFTFRLDLRLRPPNVTSILRTTYSKNPKQSILTHVSQVYRRYRFYLVRHFNNSIPTIITRIKLTGIFIFFVLVAPDFYRGVRFGPQIYATVSFQTQVVFEIQLAVFDDGINLYIASVASSSLAFPLEQGLRALDPKSEALNFYRGWRMFSGVLCD
jgi:hypothetical protein